MVFQPKFQTWQVNFQAKSYKNVNLGQIGGEKL